jgi:hypothetical protein
LLLAHRERPSRRAADKRDELAALQLTELHPLSQPWSDRIADWQASSQAFIALRNFNAAFDRFGSKAEITAPQYYCPFRLNQRTLAGGI